jgi:basic amino acid/polyamine antiporter, APA family
VPADSQRTIGVFGATMVGLGGILGGGLLMLAGVAFNRAGPAAIIALALNGVIAWMTAMSVTAITTRFPESGGAYMFAKKVLSVRAAFAVGWILWFAYIVAAVLYALGAAAFSVILLRGVCDGLDIAHPSWLAGRNVILGFASLATIAYSFSLVRSGSGGGQWETSGKIVLFVALIVAGLVTLVRQPVGDSLATLDPFFTGGVGGILSAMGLLFISLQGFEMISAVAGEIREPQKTIPRSIFLSLGISLAIYVPMMIVVAMGGVDPGGHISDIAAKTPDTVIAVAARRFLGEPGYWLIVIAIILATLSALRANLLTSSRIALAMAKDRTLPAVLDQSHATRGTPVMAIYATALAVIAIIFMIPDLASAGAAASLIFLLAFALTHVTCYLARRRDGDRKLDLYTTPAFPLIPLVGGLACAGLGAFQAIVVPDAGGIVLIWLGLGVILYFALFKGGAEVADVTAEALDPRLTRLRGKSPLVLLPLANPTNARSLVEIANALAPTEYARVLLLTIVRSPRGGGDPLAQLADAQAAVKLALTASYQAGHAPEALLTAAPEVWPEIHRIAEEHRCESMLLGLPDTSSAAYERRVEELVNGVDCDVAFMRSPPEWTIAQAARVLVPVGGRGEEHELRARLLGTLSRVAAKEILFLKVVPASATDQRLNTIERATQRLARLNIPVTPTVEIVRSDDAAAAVLERAAQCDLLILGLRSRQGTKSLGSFNRKVAFAAPCAVILLARRAAGDVVSRPIRDVARIMPWPQRRSSDTRPPPLG